MLMRIGATSTIVHEQTRDEEKAHLLEIAKDIVFEVLDVLAGTA